jgi:hypothetical protein
MAKVLCTAEAHVIGGELPATAAAAMAPSRSIEVEIDTKVKLMAGEERSFTIAAELHANGVPVAIESQP